MPTTLETAPALEPVTLDEAKAQCRVTTTTDNTYLTSLITAAREKVERDTRRALIEQTWRATLPSFPSGRIIRLERAPLISVTSVRYYDADNADTLLATADYTVNAKPTPGFVELNWDKTWPVTYDRADAVTILFKAGSGAAAAAVPGALKLAVLQLVAHWYTQRQPVNVGNLATDIPHTYENLIGLHEVNLP
jgi:uncharacterized phiE125 gp8 family phage protein